ncbi:CrcB family protein [Pseudalkalibacillus hwajinpoensis]|uniref:fluoride efflux transporter FluC n=1 Tax=Guptibacillus hwajinpoensis TaxID=208199 RepID=UPI00325BE852
MEWVMIAVGGGIGAWVRYLIATFIRVKSRFPTATFIVNMFGSFLMGIAYGSGEWGPALTTGFLGALTTFSTFIYEAYDLGVDKVWFSLLYIMLSLFGGLLMVSGGYMMVK